MDGKPPFDPFLYGLAARDFHAGGSVCVRVPADMIGVIVSALEPLKWPDLWRGNDALTVQSMRQWETLIASLGTAQNLCNGECDCTPDGEICGVCAWGSCSQSYFSECETMPMCDLPHGALRWHDGKLQYLHCGEWYDVGGVSAVVPDEPDGDIIPDPPPEGMEDSTPCAMARALAVFTYNIVVASFFEYGDEITPYHWYNEVQATFPTVALGFNALMNIYFLMIPVDKAGLGPETQDIGIVDYLKCGFVDYIEPTNGGVSSDEYSAMKSAMKGIMKGAIKSVHLGFETTMRHIWEWAFQAIGPNDAQAITYYVQPLPTDDCSCPDAPGTGSLQWTDYVELLETLPNAQDGEMNTVLAAGNTVLNVTWSGEASIGSTDNTTIFGLAAIVPVSTVVLRIAGDQLPTIEWDEECPPQTMENVQYGDFDIAAEDFEVEVGVGYIDVTFTWLVPVYLTRWGYNDSHSARWCGRNAPNPFSAAWSVTILSAT